MKCKKCKSENSVKAGLVKGNQRYKCKSCGCQYVPSGHRGKSEREKLMSIWLYMHGLSFRAIAKFLKVTHKTIYDWVKAFSEENYIKPEPQGESVVVELDEMWHYLHSKKEKFGFGKRIAAIPASSLTGKSADEIMIHFQNFMRDFNAGT